MTAARKIEIKKGDLVEVICGGSERVKTKGKRGKVQVVIPGENKVIIENLNMVKKHKKPRSAQQAGGIIDKPRAIDVSNVMLVCPECGKRTRIGHTLADDGKKYVRQCKKCQAVIDKKASKLAYRNKKSDDKKTEEKKSAKKADGDGTAVKMAEDKKPQGRKNETKPAVKETVKKEAKPAGGKDGKKGAPEKGGVKKGNK